MGYFPNATSWDFWAADNCNRCHHWPKNDDAAPCPVEMAHMLFAYDLCNQKDHPGKIMLDMLIPLDAKACSNGKCAMFVPRDGVSDRHLKDWQKYKAAMAEMERTARPNDVSNFGQSAPS